MKGLISLIAALFFGAPAFAATFEEAAHLTNPALEALMPQFQALTANAALGTCGQSLHRVKVVDLGDDILESAMNGYIASLQDANGLSYQFGLLKGIDPKADTYVASFAALAPDNSDPATMDALKALGIAASGAVSSAPLRVIQLMSGTAVYVRVNGNTVSEEADLSMRIVEDHANNELLVFSTGSCQAR